MAGIATFPPLSPVCKTNFLFRPSPSSSFLIPATARSWSRSLQRIPAADRFRALKWNKSVGMGKFNAVSEETVAPEEGGEAPVEQPVAVPVSPSDMLTMFFQAEGTISESAIPKVTKALEGTKGISDVKVQVLEGIASVELTKQTTVQATGVASNLVEIIQGSGFKLQTLNLSFEDEEDSKN